MSYPGIKINIFRSVIMFEKLVSGKHAARFLALVLIGLIVILTLSIFAESKDGRKQIIDMDGGSEERLASVLSGIKGAGEVDAVIKYDENSNVTGVIVTAEGAGNPTVANNLTKGVAALYDIPVSSVMVFEKEQEE